MLNMKNTFINPTLTKASELGLAFYQDNEPVKLLPGDSSEETEIVIRAIYRQVLGNAHIMESDRLTTAESQLSNGDITVREFVRCLAQSELYRSLFFNNYSSLRAIELNFKHLLGRAPHSYEEVVPHIQILNQEGFEAEIDSYLDSEEYLNNFGVNIVPHIQGYKSQTGKNVAGFTHLFHLLRGSCSSDRSTFAGNKPRLQTALIGNYPSSIFYLSNTSKDNDKLSSKTNQPLAPIPQREISAELSIPLSIIWQGQYNTLANASPLEVFPGSSDAEVEIVIRSVYKQVLGNAHLMESERLTVAESQFKRREISVREFVRRIAKSELYKSRFIDNCPRYRSHELNFKHLLGRAPDDYQETLFHSQILDSQGYEADIDSYIDSEEYQSAFGENIVPYYRGYKTQTGKALLGYTNMFKMLESISTSDKAGNSGNTPRLVKPIIYKNAGGNVPVTDINRLLQEVLKPKASIAAVTSESTSYVQPQPQQEIEEEKLDQQIADLKAQLAELRSFATIGAAGSSKWQSKYIDLQETSSYSSSSSWNAVNSFQAKQEDIATLKQELAQAKSLASLGEARLNKWRSRVYF